ncbi:TMEM175 family protein [Limosilactobacillus sp.]|uniref:TMEM175 family protein n=1 Tax=Limosilactobacillus sp. TaxID=2773925 RepID=UPI0025BC2406|nr:TMEM175 family protein [Limosilactobacillus sp.]MCH3921863.1 TMEM175 family protein [Limosilactobacillus sp.]MCH3928634.1 TMEM175 family protein [Limosilactobacillus sp.]
MNKSRLEAFTDAIVAIAATIMVLELHTPQEPTIHGLLEEGPTFLTYIVSFVLIYLVWYNHHNIFKKAKVITTQTYIYNGLWIFWLTLIPFTTRWVGTAPDQTLPELIYTLDLFLWSLSFQLMDRQIIKDNPEVPRDETNSFGFRAALYSVYAISIIMAFFIPVGSLILIGFIDIAWVFIVNRSYWQQNETK